MTITNEDVKAYAIIKAKIAALEKDADEYKAKFAEALEPGMKYETPEYLLTVREGRYEPDRVKFTKKYPPSRYPQYYKQVIDAVAVRGTFDEAKLEAVATRIASSFIVKAKPKTK